MDLERLKRAMYAAAERDPSVACIPPDHELDVFARAVLSCLEEAGMVVVSRSTFNEVREFVRGISEDQYTDGVPWRQAEKLLKRIPSPSSASA